MCVTTAQTFRESIVAIGDQSLAHFVDRFFVFTQSGINDHQGFMRDGGIVGASRRVSRKFAAFQFDQTIVLAAGVKSSGKMIVPWVQFLGSFPLLHAFVYP